MSFPLLSLNPTIVTHHIVGILSATSVCGNVIALMPTEPALVYAQLWLCLADGSPGQDLCLNYSGRTSNFTGCGHTTLSPDHDCKLAADLQVWAHLGPATLELLGGNLERWGLNAPLCASRSSDQQAFGVSPIPSTFQSSYVPAHGSRYCNASKKGCRKSCHGGQCFC